VNGLTRLAPLLCMLAPALLVDQAPSKTRVTPARFADVTSRATIAFTHKSGASPDKRMVETFGSGVAWIDYDNDGFPDLYFVNGAPGTSNALYHNNHDGTFTDVTAKAGVSGKEAGPAAFKTGVAVGDYDNDGRADLYVTALGPNILYRNNGDGTFVDVTATAKVSGAPTEWSTSAGFFDYDRDGKLDLFVVNYVDYRVADNPYCGQKKDGYRMYCNPKIFDGTADRLFHNNGDGTFTDVSQRAGIANPAGKGLGVTFCDVDRDGWPDIYVANDTVRNFLYRNKHDGTFEDVTYAAGVGFDSNGKPRAGMGVDCADLDGDGLPDLFVTNFSEELNALFMNRGDGTFDDKASTPGLRTAYLSLGFGTKLFDVDNDGDLDIYVTNGHVIDNVKLYQTNLSYAQPDLLYENLGGGAFRDITAQSGPALQVARVGRGLAVADFDNDGRLDVAINNLDRAPVLLKNQGAAADGSWLTVQAKGRKSNSAGLGATVTIETSEGTQVREINNVASYLSSSDTRLHVGLGRATIVKRLEILWPGGARQVLENVKVNHVLVIEEVE
jgi:enediyne biosynthesis protein E4